MIEEIFLKHEIEARMEKKSEAIKTIGTLLMVFIFWTVFLLSFVFFYNLAGITEFISFATAGIIILSMATGFLTAVVVGIIYTVIALALVARSITKQFEKELGEYNQPDEEYEEIDD